ncbi:MerR family transcriptional regulator [Hoeflea poritis]|uniref:Helix-turn-helix domain-containing protein n=1 Tax=Hoeflea poritis TaxID=2993659 RepID=A0ABT4VW05_9HYPH|nr:helix-turn-helix domain-containing protein [Hoeflea poritis]MDA4848897.1 helix-turn-helix domain-containing protein [Hoeflea poritis]
MISIGQAAERSGVTIETIRYYEREGIVPKPDRTASGRRTYSERGVARLRFVKRCRELGFPIPGAKSLLGLTDGSQKNCATAQTIASKHLKDVQDKMVDLKSMESALIEMIRLCDGNDDECPILNHLLSEREES